MRLGGRGSGEAFVPCGGSWGLLQPVPRGMVGSGETLITGLTSDFFVQLIAVRAYLELVGDFFKEKSRFLPPVSPRHVCSRC